MLQTVPTDFKNRVITTINDSETELWFPNLTYDLSQTGLNKLYEETRIAKGDYGTARVILKNPEAERTIEKVIFSYNDLEEIKTETFIEKLPEKITKQYKESGIDFYTSEEIRKNTEITDYLKDAFDVIKLVPSLYKTVQYLVKSIHLIKPEDDEYDISFSEPHIPFSIFISVPQKANQINFFRVAEAIIHEAMHLQLTLIERIVPLVLVSDNLYFSPWKSEFRKVSGILHALYVFRVIYNFYKQLAYCLPSEKHKNYLVDRRNLISQEFTYVNNIDLLPDFTKIGNSFASRLTANQT